MKLNILGKRYLFFLLSLAMIIPGLVIIAIHGLPLSIDFTGGSMLELQFDSAKVPTLEEVSTIYTNVGITDTQVQFSPGDNNTVVVIKSSSLTQDQHNTIIADLQNNYDANLIERKFDTVGPSISQSVTQRALLAIAIAAIAVIIYITIAFKGVTHAFRYGVCAIIAMIHDILIVVSLGAIGSQLFGWQMDSLYLTALLTVIGFSTQDKIVVFDRIRENSPIMRRVSFEKIVNHSIVQSLQRSINTQLMTSEFLLLSLALFGGETLREMCIILLVGLLSGTYSSIFIASPILVVWENKEWKTWFRKAKTTEA
ncbi:MAG: preprotein translocase subunit SecF [Chloroflexota bacterium]|nr:preprotein translocase subunit SecF [Chloroflexota bacterium]